MVAENNDSADKMASDVKQHNRPISEDMLIPNTSLMIGKATWASSSIVMAAQLWLQVNNENNRKTEGGEEAAPDCS